MIKIVERFKKIGDTIQSIWTRLGQPDIYDEDVMLGEEFEESKRVIEEIVEKYEGKGAIPNRSNSRVVEQVKVDSEKALNDAKTKTKPKEESERVYGS